MPRGPVPRRQGGAVRRGGPVLGYPGAGQLRDRHPGAVVGDLDGQLVVPVAEQDPARAGAGVLDHVGQRLLDDPVGRQVDARGQVARLAVARHVDPHARARGPGDQPVQVGQPGRGVQRRSRPAGGRRRARLGPGTGAGAGTQHRADRRSGTARSRVGVVGLPQRAQHPAHLVQRLAAGGLDGAERVPGVTRLGVDHVLAVARLDRDHAHAVRDHVVQFPGDAQSLLGDGLAGRLVLQPDRVPAALAHVVADDPDDDHAQRDRDQAALVEEPPRPDHQQHGVDEQGDVHRYQDATASRRRS